MPKPIALPPMKLLQEIKPSIDGEKYARVKINGEWFTLPRSVLLALERSGDA